MTNPAASAPISVIIPAFNTARYLAGALESVRAQTLQPEEIIVVDNGSADETARTAVESGARCEYEPLRGAGYARNRGIAAARGDFFAILDADDLWMPRKLEWQMAVLDADPQCEAVFGLIEHFLSPDLEPANAAGLHCPQGAQPARFPNLMLIRRGSFERVGPFVTDVALGELVDWMARAEAATCATPWCPMWSHAAAFTRTISGAPAAVSAAIICACSNKNSTGNAPQRASPAMPRNSKMADDFPSALWPEGEHLLLMRAALLDGPLPSPPFANGAVASSSTTWTRAPSACCRCCAGTCTGSA